MLYSETIINWKDRQQELVSRLIRSAAGLSEEALNRRPDPRVWSPAQVVEHMTLANRLYLKALKLALDRAEKSDRDVPVRHRFFAKFLIKADGPDGNAPAPLNEPHIYDGSRESTTE